MMKRPARRSESATRTNAGSRQRKLSVPKKVLFSVLTVAGFFGCLEILLALVGVHPMARDADPYVGFASNIPLFVEQGSVAGSDTMVTAPNKRNWFNIQEFSKRKPAGTYRIFSLGGSTTYGRPYDDRGSFSGWLREFLPAADPTRDWEVINAGGVSYASYRVAVVMEELVRYDPDLFIIYSGQNEFLERRTYGPLLETPSPFIEAGGLLSRTRIWAAAQHFAGATSPAGYRTIKAVLPGEVDTLLAHTVGPSDYTRDDGWRGQVIEHYRFNLNRMIDTARSVGAGVVLVVPASNLKDCSPFKSEHAAGLTTGEAERFDERYRRAAGEQRAGRSKEALTLFDEAASIDDRYADLHYQRGLALYALGRWERAKEAFRRAVDEDVCPLRAPSEIKAVIAEVAAERGVPLIDFAASVERQAPNGIPGSESFLDHVHPTLAGHRPLALQIIETMELEGILRLAKSWNDDAIAAVAPKVEGRIDTRAQGEALHNLARVFSWTGQLQEAERLAIQALEALGEDSETHNLLGQIVSAAGRSEEAARHFRTALELSPGSADAHSLLGMELVSQDRPKEAVLHLERALRAGHDNADTHAALGLAWASMGKIDDAVRQYEKALEINPAHPEAYGNLGAELFAQGRVDEAVRHPRAALRLKPNYADAHTNLGLAFASQDRVDEAIRHYGRAVEAQPDHTEAHYNLAHAYFSQGRTAEAIDHFRQAVRINPHSAEAHYNLGVALLSVDEPKEAVGHLNLALQINPELAEAHPELERLPDFQR